ncbi:MAG: enoyl-CoA hydratase/isomerase family protein [Firmicutes bacterium]|nr:enoyl-CoA hydratase/isomerase family protein [Bacillota bacterium]
MSNVEVEWGAISIVRLNRPSVLNALNRETLTLLIEELEKLGRNPDVEVVILTATGDRAFCAGADLAEVQQLETPAAVRVYFGLITSAMAALEQLPQPTIGAAFGYTLAGGMGLAASVDLLVAAEDTRFGLPEMKVGLYPMIVTAPIERLIGPRRTLELSLTGRQIDVRTAESWGLVNRVVPAGQALIGAQELADEIARGSPVIARMGKEGWRLARDMGSHEAREALKNLVSLVALTADAREGMAAFQEKRAPRWPSKRPDDQEGRGPES